MKVILTKGLPASGKSTYAKELLKTGNWTRVNKDDLRALLHNGKWSRENEKQVEAARDALILSSLNRGSNVVVDDTNLHPKHEARIREIVKWWAAEQSEVGRIVSVSVEIKDFTNIPLDECIRRDSKRANYVGAAVIKRMHNQFLRKVETPVFDPNLPTVVIYDLDGTAALFGDANPYDRDFLSDKPNEAVRTVLLSLQASTTYAFIAFSGRNGKYEEVTRTWLGRHGFPLNELYMRADGDTRKDSIVKREFYDAHIRGKYNVALVLDDRNQVVEVWRELGLTCFQVAEGDF